MAAVTRPIAVRTEAAMFAALAGVVAMMAFTAIGGSGLLTAAFRGLLAGLVVFVSLLALLPDEIPAPEAAPEPMPAAPEADSAKADGAEAEGPVAEPGPDPAEGAPVAVEEVAAPEPDAEPEPTETEAAQTAEVVAEPAGETAPEASADGVVRPAALAAPRGGAADDLKRIKGVGPKLEAALNAAGFWHFDQIAGWSATELAWVDESVPGVRGRATRDDWVGQAQRLAAEAAAVAG